MTASRGGALGGALMALCSCAHQGLSPSEFYAFDGDVHRGPKISKACAAALAERSEGRAVQGALVVNADGKVGQGGGGELARMLADCRLEPARIGGRTVDSRGEAEVQRTAGGTSLLFSTVKVGDVELPTGKCAGPDYPVAARASGIEGCVRMSVGVDATGKLHDPKTLDTPSQELAQASLAQIASCRMAPATRRGRPLAVRIEYSFCFVLD